MPADSNKTQWPSERPTNTPFRALAEYDRLIGEMCKEAKTWRRVACISMLSFFVSLGVIVYALSLPKTVPVVITMSDWGEAKYIGEVSKFSYQGIKVPEIAIHYQLRKFIINMNSIPADPDVLIKNLTDCYSALTSTSASKFSNIIRADNPLKKVNQTRQNVSIETIIAVSENTYQIDYVITTTQPNDSRKTQTRLRAVCTTRLMEPAKEDQILNPLGIYITGFDISPIGVIK